MKQVTTEKQPACTNCGNCHKLAKEKERSTPASKTADNGLYNSEALTYYYYFAPSPRKAS